MKKIDYIIVGCGLAGISFCERLQHYQKSYVVVEDNSQQTSTIAGGLYNPVILKRFTKAWEAEKQLQLAMPMYKQLEKKLNVKLDYKTSVYRLFSSIEEQNNWFQASDNPILSYYLSTTLVKEISPYLKNKFGYGQVMNTGRIDTATLVKNYKLYLKHHNNLINQSFIYDELQIVNDKIMYQNFEAKHIVFAEGFGLNQNPLFNYLPLDGTKGELITIYAPDLKLDIVLKSSVFLIPLGNDLYRLGATYNWNDKTTKITKEGKNELLDKLTQILTCDFEVVDHMAGIRPTVKDRRPLVGEHPKHKNLYVLNGLGTRGVMIGPYVAHQLFNFIEEGKALDKEVDIKRYQHLCSV